MLAIVALILAIVILLVLSESESTSKYDEFCNLECWSRRKPCCKTS